MGSSVGTRPAGGGVQASHQHLRVRRGSGGCVRVSLSRRAAVGSQACRGALSLPCARPPLQRARRCRASTTARARRTSTSATLRRAPWATARRVGRSRRPRRTSFGSPLGSRCPEESVPRAFPGEGRYAGAGPQGRSVPALKKKKSKAIIVSSYHRFYTIHDF